MNNSLLLYQKPKESLEQFLHIYKKTQNIDIEYAKSIIQNTINYYSDNLQKDCFCKLLEQQWYDSLQKEYKPDYTVYNDDYYFTDLWTCWEIYSRKYLLSIEKENSLSKNPKEVSIYSEIKDSKMILDLGCGIGYTTASLKQIFRNSKVYGTNIKNTKQYKFCKRMSKKYNFTIISSIKYIKHKIDFIVAFEYFEHRYDALEHLKNILNELNPKYLYIANAFNTISVGHFLYYKSPDRLIDIHQSNMTKLFNSILINYRYKKAKTNLWNNRPSLWIKQNKKKRPTLF